MERQRILEKLSMMLGQKDTCALAMQIIHEDEYRITPVEMSRMLVGSLLDISSCDSIADFTTIRLKHDSSLTWWVNGENLRWKGMWDLNRHDDYSIYSHQRELIDLGITPSQFKGKVFRTNNES